MATSNQQRQELHKTIGAVAKENGLQVEIDKIITDLEEEAV